MNVMVKNNVEVRDAFRKEDYSFTVDWLNVRLDCDNINYLLLRIFSLFPEIDVTDWEVRDKGVCFYKEAVYLPEVGYSSVVIAFNRDDYGNIINTPTSSGGGTYGILVSISGDGCRYINSLHDNGFFDLLKAFAPFNPHCTRIDVACDIFDKDNQLVPMLQTFCDYAYDRENALIDFNCNLNRKPGWVTANLVYDDVVKDFTRNITIGGRSSTKGTLQLYNKRMEVLSGRLSDVSDAILNALGNPDYWWRLEYRCKSFAQKVYDTLAQSGNIYQTFLCAADEMGAFVVSIPTNIQRAETCVEWLAFLAFIQKLIENKVFILYNSAVNLPYVGSELARNERFHNEQVMASDAINIIHLMLDADYRESFFDKVRYHLLFNKKLRPVLKELSVKYGLKLEELNNLVWEQSSLYDDVV